MYKVDVNIQNVDGVLEVDSRDVAIGLEKEHSDVMRKIREVLGVGEFSESSYINSQNKKQPCMKLTKDGFILLVMNYTGYNDFKRAYIKKFNEMSDQLTEIEKLHSKLFSSNPIEVKEASNRLIELKTKELKEKIESDAEKVAFAEAIEKIKGGIRVGCFAKTIYDECEFGRNKMYNWLRSGEYVMNDSTEPTQKSMSLGVMRLIPYTYEDADGVTHYATKTIITGKGQTYFANKLKKYMEESKW